MTRLTDADDLLLESSGAPVSEWDEIAVLDDRDRAVPDGEPGELVTQRAVHHSRLLQRPRHQCPGVHGRTASTGWATSSGSGDATSTPRAAGRTSSIAAARRSAATKSRT